MQLAQTIAHLFIPRESNNQKAKLLHNSFLLLIAGFLLTYQLSLSAVSSLKPSILGFASQISVTEVVSLTNQKRAEAGLSALTINQSLNEAALAKGNHMLAQGYWAHVAPDGTQPWTFFTNAGYKYRYAGENLAKDFSSAGSAVDAWMASPSHKENILSGRYKDTGIAVVEGNLAGVETTIIVQLFGATSVDTVPIVPVAQAKTAAPTALKKPEVPKSIVLSTPNAIPTSEPASEVATAVNKAEPRVLISPFTSTKAASVVIVGILLTVFALDAVLMRNRAVVRIGGRTFAHIAFLGIIFAIALILKAGQII